MKRRRDWGGIAWSLAIWGIVAALTAGAFAATWYANVRVYGDGTCMFVTCVKVKP